MVPAHHVGSAGLDVQGHFTLGADQTQTGPGREGCSTGQRRETELDQGLHGEQQGVPVEQPGLVLSAALLLLGGRQARVGMLVPGEPEPRHPPVVRIVAEDVGDAQLRRHLQAAVDLPVEQAALQPLQLPAEALQFLKPLLSPGAGLP